jgi:hypothetical protein
LLRFLTKFSQKSKRNKNKYINKMSMTHFYTSSKNTIKRFSIAIVMLMVGLLATQHAVGQISMTAAPTSYSQNFNTLAPDQPGTNVTWTDNTTIPGWYANQTTYRSYNTGDAAPTNRIWSCGTGTTDTDRSLGSIMSSTTVRSWAIKLTNNTGAVLNDLTLGLDALRPYMTGSGSAFLVQYSTAASPNISDAQGSANWTSIASITTPSAGLSYALSSLGLANGSTITIRFVPSYTASNLSLWALDNFTATWGAAAPAPELNVLDGATSFVCGAAPAITIGSANVGSPTASKTITLDNSAGAAALSITNLTLSNAEFTFASAPTFPITVAAGASTTIGIILTPSAAGARTGTLTIANNDANEGSCVINLTGTGVSSSPTLVPSTASLSGFCTSPATFSSAQTFTLSTLNTDNTDITLTAPASFEISTDGGTTYGGTRNLTAFGAGPQTIYVRIVSGATAGAKTGNISIAGASYATEVVAVSGNVGTPTITATGDISGVTYAEGSGPSANDNFTIAATSLCPAAGNITVAAATNFEVSTTGTGGWAASVTYPYTGGALSTTTVYSRLKTGLVGGAYSENITISGGGATSVTVPASGTVTAPVVVSTKVFDFVAASPNYTAPSYIEAGVGSYAKSSSGGTISFGSTTCNGYNVSAGTSSNTFFFKAEDAITGLDLNGVGTGSNRTFTSISYSDNLTDTFTPLATASGTGSISGSCGTIAIDAGTTIPAGKWIKVVASGNINITDLVLKLAPTGPELNMQQAGSDLVCGGAAFNVGTSPVGTALNTVFTIQNTGSTAMTISSITATGDYTIVPTAPVSCPGNSSVSVTVAFTPSAAGTRTGSITINNNESADGVVETACVINLTGIGTPTVPTLIASPTPLTGMTYVQGSGPSNAMVLDIDGWNLTPGNVTISGLNNFQISTDGGTTWSAGASTTFAFGTSNFSRSVMVRLKTGLSVNTNYSESVVVSTNGLSQAVTLQGSVTLPVPVLTATPTALTGMTYLLGSGPSAQVKTFTISGVNLLPGDITVAAPTNFQVSTDGVTFSNSLTIPQYNLPTTTIYTRLITGRPEASYTGDVQVYGGGVPQASAELVSLSGQVYSASSTIDCPGTYAYGVGFSTGAIGLVSGAGSTIERMTINYTPSATIPLPVGSYAIASNPQALNPDFQAIVGGQNQLIINSGGTTANGTAIVYEMDVVEGQTYEFSYTISNLVPAATTGCTSTSSALRMDLDAAKMYTDNTSSSSFSPTMTSGSLSTQTIPFGGSLTYRGTFTADAKNRIRLTIKKESSSSCSAIGFSGMSVQGCPPYEITTDQPGDKVCQGEPVVLTVTNAPAGASFIWQSRASGSSGAWTTIASTTNTATLAPTFDTEYRVLFNGFTLLKTVRAVVCCSTMGNRTVVLVDDFGTVAAGARASNANVTGHTYNATTNVNDGQYAVVSHAQTAGTWFQQSNGHTNGSNTDGHLVLNADGIGDVCFSKRYGPLCPNTIYDLSAFIMNLDNDDEPASYPNLTFQVWSDGHGAMLESVNSGDIPWDDTNDNDWYERGISFNSGANTYVYIDIVNNKDAGGGNDLALDDITFTTCTPQLDLYSDLPTLTIDQQICENVIVPVTASTPYPITQFYPTPYYYFQRRVNGGAWANVGSASTTNVYNFDPTPYSVNDVITFRTIIAPTAAIANTVAAALLVPSTPVLAACETYALSNEVDITKLDPITMGADTPMSGCPGQSLSLVGVTNASWWSWGTATNPEAYQVRTSTVGLKTLARTVTVAEDVYFYGWSSNNATACRAEQMFPITIPVISPPVPRVIAFCMENPSVSQSWVGASATYNPVPTSAGMTPWFYVDNNPVTIGTSTVPTYMSGSAGSLFQWVSYRNATGCESTRVPATVDISAGPPAPTVTNQTECQAGAGSVTYSAATNVAGGSLLWYSAATGGVGSATVPTQSRANVGVYTMYVSQVQAGCEGIRIPVTVTIVSSPTTTPVTGASLCGTGSLVLTATPSTGATLNWFAASSGGTSLGSGTTYTTPSISATTTYYVEASAGSCTSSPRTAVTATINPIPAAIAGPTSVCMGSTITLTDATGGGAWTSTATGVATISAGGVVTPVSAGSTTINYTVAGCPVTHVVTVNPTPAAITGNLNVCMGTTTTLASTTLGGTWTSATPARATIDANGIVTPVSAGTSLITYTVNGCSVTATVTVRPLPVVALTVPGATVCPGSVNGLTTSLTTATTAPYTYTWTNATSSGATTANFTAPAGCTNVTAVTVQVSDNYGCIGSDTENINSGDATNPVITGTITAATATGCNATVAPAAVSTVLALEGMGLAISDNCTADGSLVVTSSDAAPTGTCALSIIRTYTVTDACGNFSTANQTITINRADFTMPANGASTVSCPAAANTAPTLPTINDACGTAITPGAVTTSAALTCEGTRTYTYPYTDCAGHTHNWVYTYTVDYSGGLTAPANGTSTVACPALAVDPGAPANITDACGRTVTATLIGQDAATPACEGTVVWRYRYTACDGTTTADWTHTYTIERADFTMPANGASTVSCPAAANTAPTLPTINDACGTAITPGAVVTSAALTCEGTRTYTYPYTDCEGNTHNWVYTYTVDYSGGLTAPANGTSTVACPALAVDPGAPANITDACGRTVTATLIGQDAATPACEGTVVWRYRYTACDGTTTADWTHTYTIERADFTMPANGASTVSCPAAANTAPTLPTINDACGTAITPGAVVTSAALTCEGTRTYTYPYTDCEGNTHNWVYTYTVDYSGGLTAPANGTSTVACPALAVDPGAPANITDACGRTVTATLIGQDAATPACEGTVVWRYRYTACDGTTTADWTHTYTIERADFTMPANGASTVSCPAAANTAPTLPTINDACGTAITPGAVVTSAALTCEGTRTYTYPYTDCEGNTHNWVYTYTVDYSGGLTAPANGTSTVACPALAVDPGAPANITDACGRTVTATLIGQDAATPACEGSVVWRYRYTACDGTTTADWTHTYTIERADFTMPANGASTVSCPAAANTAPTLPTINDACGTAITPGAVVTSAALTCEGTRTYTYPYTDCEGNTHNWVYTYTVDYSGGLTAPANGTSTVACPALAVDPGAPANITDACGRTVTATLIGQDAATPACEGTVVWRYRYTACDGTTTADWTHTYTIERADFTMPANGASTVSCPAAANTAPTLPTINDACGTAITPGAVVTSAALTCEGTRTYTYPYTDCEGNTHNWVYTYTVDYTGALTAPANGTSTVSCPALAVDPGAPANITDACGRTVTATLIGQDAATPACEGSVVWRYRYTACDGTTTADWTHTYTIDYSGGLTAPANGTSTVACPALAVDPGAPANITDACGRTVSAVLIGQDAATPACEGSVVWRYRYTACDGTTTADWTHTYTIERADFTMPADGASTVSCPAASNAAPALPTINDACGNALTPGAVVTSAALTCEGTRTYTYPYTDCEGNTHNWVYTYTVDYSGGLTAPANGTSTVACPADAVDPGAPANITDACGRTVTATLIGQDAATPACEGSVVWRYRYTACDGTTTADWTHTYTIERPDFTMPADGGSTVTCPDATDTAPTLPTVTDACGVTLTPGVAVVSAKPVGTGTRTYTYPYTDCEGNTHNWVYTYTVSPSGVTLPANGASTVICSDATDAVPTPPSVTGVCCTTLTPAAPVVSAKPACEGTRTYTWTYTDCDASTYNWTYTYTVDYTGALTAPANGTSTVSCPALAVDPGAPANITDACGRTVTATLIGQDAATPACEGSVVWRYRYTACDGTTTADWTHTYTIDYSGGLTAPANGTSL